MECDYHWLGKTFDWKHSRLRADLNYSLLSTLDHTKLNFLEVKNALEGTSASELFYAET